jgi:hypothetical protein
MTVEMPILVIINLNAPELRSDVGGLEENWSSPSG